MFIDMNKKISFLINGKPHHYKVINIVNKNFKIDKIIYDIDELNNLNNSFIFVMYSKIIPENIINNCFIKNNLLLNLHSSNTKKYRGLDCEFWPLFYDKNIICTLHKLEKEIDSGDIYLQRSVDLNGVNNVIDLKDRIGECYADLINIFLLKPKYYITNPKGKGTGKYYKNINNFIYKFIIKNLNEGRYDSVTR